MEVKFNNPQYADRIIKKAVLSVLQQGSIEFLTAGNIGAYIQRELPPAPPVQLATSEGVFNCRAFGAVGDGIADDTAALQATIDAASHYGTVNLVRPANFYRITAPLQLNWIGQSIIGSSTHIQMSGAGGNLIEITNHDNYLCNLILDSDTHLNNGGAILINGTNQVFLDRLQMYGVERNVLETTGSFYITVRDCLISAFLSQAGFSAVSLGSLSSAILFQRNVITGNHTNNCVTINRNGGHSISFIENDISSGLIGLNILGGTNIRCAGYFEANLTSINIGDPLIAQVPLCMNLSDNFFGFNDPNAVGIYIKQGNCIQIDRNFFIDNDGGINQVCVQAAAAGGVTSIYQAIVGYNNLNYATGATPIVDPSTLLLSHWLAPGIKEGFYGNAPVAIQALAVNPTTAEISTVLHNLGMVT